MDCCFLFFVKSSFYNPWVFSMLSNLSVYLNIRVCNKICLSVLSSRAHCVTLRVSRRLGINV